MWAFIKYLVVADVEFCRKLSRYHGDIQPRLVMLSKEGKLYLNDILSYTPSMEDGYLRMLNSPTYVSPLSPEAIEELNRKAIHPEYDMNKNDVFAIAITVLLSCSDPMVVSQGLGAFYKRTGGQVTLNSGAIDNALNHMLNKQQRSPVLVNALRIMLSEKQADRPTLYQILEFMRVASA